jgi:hypothetical protein
MEVVESSWGEEYAGEDGGDEEAEAGAGAEGGETEAVVAETATPDAE